MKKLLVTAVLPFLVTAAQADNFRCGKWIATPDMSVSELLAKCGEPATRESRKEDVYGKGLTGGTYKIGETTIETWTYPRGTGASPIVVTIVDGKIERMERQQQP